MAKRLTRRDFLRMATFATGGAILAACAPQPAATQGRAQYCRCYAPPLIEAGHSPSVSTSTLCRNGCKPDGAGARLALFRLLDAGQRLRPTFCK